MATSLESPSASFLEKRAFSGGHTLQFCVLPISFLFFFYSNIFYSCSLARIHMQIWFDNNFDEYMLNFDIRWREGGKKGDLKWIRVYNKRLLLPQKNAAHEIKIGMAKCAACTCLFFVPLHVCLWGTQRFRFAAFCCYFASHIGFNAYQKKREIIRSAGQFCWAVLIVRATHKTC